VKARMTKLLNRAIAAAASLGGKRFGLLVASSLVATTAIIASALISAGDSGALAALLGRDLASSKAPAATKPAPDPLPAAGSSAPTQGGSTSQAGGPLASPAPAEAPAASGPVNERATKKPTTPTTPTTSKAGRVKHVFIISLASPSYEATFGATPQMPYLTSLRSQGELLSGYSLIDDAGLANDIAAISGQPPNPSTQANCSTYAEFAPGAALDAKGIVSGSGCAYPVETLTVADQLASARFRWHAYMEGMVDETGKPDNCVYPDPGTVDQPPSGAYAARRNPFVYFHSLIDVGDCAINDFPLTQLETDLRKPDSAPNYSFISPTPCNAGVAGQCPEGAPSGAAAADAFLSQWVPKILASGAYKRDGLLIVSFDEIAAPAPPPTDPAAAPAPAPAPPSRQVGALLLSPFVSPGATDAAPYDPYSLLRSVEDLFGLEHLAKANGAKVRSFAPALLGKPTAGD
jgi:phosphatidylinositol-3-phosphatase